MFLYLTATGQYARTQAEAGKGATRVDVPTDARGLVAYLNEITAPPCDCGRCLDCDAREYHADVARASQSPAEPAPALILRDPAGIQPDVPLEAPKPTQAHTARSITDFILDEATVAQVENVLACLGTRVAELAKGARS